MPTKEHNAARIHASYLRTSSGSGLHARQVARTHIQTAIGWTNSHLHHFEIKGRRYGDPELLQDGFDEFECLDSTAAMVGDMMPKTGKRFAFSYEYDFGDGWEHEVMFEGCPPVEKGKKYPICVEMKKGLPDWRKM